MPDAFAAEAEALPGNLAHSPHVAVLLERLGARTADCLAHLG